ncbi:hypothetical protein LCGC14_0364950 [marine sediment metagenome]|uniref:Uncharacterized protein n=1 Tax=marine sediment metagenome TaxID=412755 RepID=A0A0F9WFE4_9ZZZZ
MRNTSHIIIFNLEQLINKCHDSFESLFTPTIVPEEGKYIKPDKELIEHGIKIYSQLIKSYIDLITGLNSE